MKLIIIILLLLTISIITGCDVGEGTKEIEICDFKCEYEGWDQQRRCMEFIEEHNLYECGGDR